MVFGGNNDNNKKTNNQLNTKKRDKLTEDEVSNINFFHEDLVALDEEVKIADKVYDEIHGLYSNLTGGEYVPTKNLRDVAELAKNMISARTYHADAVNKRIALKKMIADMNYRNNGGGVSDENELAINTARQIVNIIRENNSSNTQQSKKSLDKRTSEGKKRLVEEELLNKNIEKHIDDGDIVFGINDKLVGKNDFIVSRYDPKKEEFIAIDSRNGEIIENFPKDRLPQGKITKTNRESVTLMCGEEVKVYDQLEFDNDYVDDGD